MTIKELHESLGKFIEDGHGDKEICFDTEATKWNYHYVPVSYASIGLSPGITDDLLILTTSLPHPISEEAAKLLEETKDES